jgi:hypothetical protein
MATAMPENNRGTATRRGPGRPFQPAVSGNPGGHPKLAAEIRELARDQTNAAIRTLVAVMKSGKSDSARVAAALALLDRGWGKPTQAMDATPGESQLFPPGFFAAVVTGERRQFKACFLSPGSALGARPGFARCPRPHGCRERSARRSAPATGTGGRGDEARPRPAGAASGPSASTRRPAAGTGPPPEPRATVGAPGWQGGPR